MAACPESECRHELIVMLAHELANPLQAIKMAGSAVGHLSEGAPIATRIDWSVRRMQRIIEQFVDCAQVTRADGLQIRRREADLHEIVLGVVEELRAIHRSRTILLEARGDTWGVFDPDRLAQVVINLGTNALRYGDPQATVTIRVHTASARLILEVHNEGDPIPPEVFPSLLNPAFPSAGVKRPTLRGCGFGLYLVKTILDKHGGHLEMRSSLAEGTTFSAILPHGR